ncbi:cytochrome P450 [Mycena galopus ATCC 62051]|nr:cytochrome P450 [Mycena galopus ATCC 62051]
MVQIMGQKICIINSYEVANDLLNERSLIYNDRPAMPMVNDLMDWKFNMSLQPYGSVYKKHRKAFQHGFNRRESNGYQHVQTRENTLLLEKLLTDPSKYDSHLRITTGAIIMMIGLGYPITENDEFGRIARFIMFPAQLAMVSAARPGAYLVDLLPILKYVPEWFPGASFQTVAREGRELSEELQNKPFAWALKQFKAGIALPSFFKDLMENKEVASDDPEEAQRIMKCATAVMYATGADTILASTLTFILAMLHAPHIQKIAQEELDRVVGTDRLPTYADQEALPYINAIEARGVWATQKFLNMGKISRVAHATSEDDIYKGYFIRKGTMVLPNVWAMVHDESVYGSHPDQFNPERFLNGDGQLNDDDHILAFGFGRRICIGRYAADATVWATIVSVLSTFNIAKAQDETGKEIEIELAFTDGLIR